MSEYILKMDNIKKSFGGVKALKGVSINIKKGEVHCLAGENGCGKSTLIKVISGFYEADSGEIEINGTKFQKLTPKQAISEGIQVIYQDFSIFPNLTVMENLAINMELSNGRKIVNYKRFEKIAKEALSKIDIKMDLYELVENLPVAQKQLIAICRALLNDAKLIIMDEPTTALTKKEVKSLFEIIKRLQSQGIAILFVSHKLDEVFEISQRFTICRSGQNVFSGDTNELDDKKFTYYMTGREFEDAKTMNPITTDEVVLKAHKLNLKNAFKDINFTLKKGEILGITGLLGSGRTELVQTLFGYRKADSGDVFIGDKKCQINSVEDAIKLGIGYVPEDRLTEGLFLMRSIENNMLTSKWDEYSNSLGVLNGKKLDDECDKWVKNFSIATKNPELPVQTLSGGNQQKVVLARWVSIDLKVLILNGPTVGVDIGAKHDIHKIIREMTEKGLSVIMISDDLPEILENCHRTLIMRGGRIVSDVLTKDTNQAQLAALATNAQEVKHGIHN